MEDQLLTNHIHIPLHESLQTLRFRGPGLFDVKLLGLYSHHWYAVSGKAPAGCLSTEDPTLEDEKRKMDGRQSKKSAPQFGAGAAVLLVSQAGTHTSKEDQRNVVNHTARRENELKALGVFSRTLVPAGRHDPRQQRPEL